MARICSNETPSQVQRIQSAWRIQETEGSRWMLRNTVKVIPAASASAGGSQVVFFCFQPQRLNPVGEECKRGRKERGEPGLSKSSNSKESNAGHTPVHHSAPVSVSVGFFNLQVHQGLHEPRSGQNHWQLWVPGLCQAELPEQAQREPAKDCSGQNNLGTTSGRARWGAQSPQNTKSDQTSFHGDHLDAVFFFFLQTSELLRKLHYRLMVRRYVRSLTPQKKAQVKPTRTELSWVGLVCNDGFVVVSA